MAKKVAALEKLQGHLNKKCHKLFFYCLAL